MFETLPVKYFIITAVSVAIIALLTRRPDYGDNIPERKGSEMAGPSDIREALKAIQ